MKSSGWLAAALIAASAQTAVAADKFVLKSADIASNAKIADKHVFKGFGCEGGNVSPVLEWSGAPANTKSFAVVLQDLSGNSTHWVIWNVAATATGLPAAIDRTLSLIHI